MNIDVIGRQQETMRYIALIPEDTLEHMVKLALMLSKDKDKHELAWFRFSDLIHGLSELSPMELMAFVDEIIRYKRLNDGHQIGDLTFVLERATDELRELTSISFDGNEEKV